MILFIFPSLNSQNNSDFYCEAGKCKSFSNDGQIHPKSSKITVANSLLIQKRLSLATKEKFFFF